MSLTKSIRFRYLAAQLNPTEINTFINRLLQTQPNIILKSLFEHFIASTTNKDEVDITNKSLSDIIQSRKQKPKRIFPQHLKLDQLPKSLIGHTASFLNQYEYINLSKSNRSIYLGSNSPNLLQTLDLQNIKDYSCIKWSNYSSLRNLAINATRFPYHLRFDSHIFNDIEELTLNAQNKLGFIKLFSKTNIIDTHNVTKLKCIEFGNVADDMIEMPKDEFLGLLQNYPNLQYLELWHVLLTEDVTAKEIHNLCPNLIGLVLSDGDVAFNNDIIRIFSNKLESLWFNQMGQHDYNFDKYDFSKLEKITMIKPSTQSFDNILKTASNLRALALSTHYEAESLMNDDEIKHMITNVIKKCKLLNYMEFITISMNFASILFGIECGLFETKKRNIKQMQINIDICDRDFKLNDSVKMMSIGRIINLLEKSRINHWIFMLELNHILDKDDMNEILNRLNDLSPNINVINQQQRFVITNQNCNINGWSKSFE